MSPTDDSRVLKKLRPGERGTRKLLDRYGNKLLCVRYRESPDRTSRFTTVELIIEERPHTPTNEPVRIHTEPGEQALRARLIREGAQWNPRTRLWLTTRAVAHALGITHRIR